MVTTIGSRLQELREARGWSLQELSRRTSFSPSFLSQLERGRCSVSITSLDRIARELGVHIAEFFPPPPRSERNVTRQGQRQKILVEGSLLSYEPLSGDFPNRIMETFLIHMEPGQIQDVPYRHEGEEFGYVLRGRLTTWLDGEEIELGPGDTVHFPSTQQHSWENRGHEPVEAIWVITYRIF